MSFIQDSNGIWHYNGTPASTNGQSLEANMVALSKVVGGTFGGTITGSTYFVGYASTPTMATNASALVWLSTKKAFLAGQNTSISDGTGPATGIAGGLPFADANIGSPSFAVSGGLARGAGSFAAGETCVAATNFSIAIGDNCKAGGGTGWAVAIGSNAIANGDTALAIHGTAVGPTSIAIGGTATTTNVLGIALGNSATAVDGTSIGQGTLSSSVVDGGGDYYSSVSLGFYTQAIGGIALGVCASYDDPGPSGATRNFCVSGLGASGFGLSTYDPNGILPDGQFIISGQASGGWGEDIRVGSMSVPISNAFAIGKAIVNTLASSLVIGWSSIAFTISQNSLSYTGTSTFAGVVSTNAGVRGNAVSSGALPTISISSSTGVQVLTTRNTTLVVPITFNPTGIATSTVIVALSPDGTTYSTLVTKTLPAVATLAGAVDEVSVQVPAGWFVKLTSTNATIGTGTYY